MTTASFELFLLWSLIFACNSIECIAGVPRISLSDGTILSQYEDVKIEHGEPLELFCTGQSHNLEMTKEGVELTIATVNETTVRFFTEKPERQDTYFYCEDANSSGNATGVRVLVDSPPLVTNFHCKSKNLEYLNCTWESLNVFNVFSLYFIKEEITYNFLLCELSKYDSLYCVWDTKHPSIPYQEFDEKLNFIIQTCNGLGCGNQTFLINHVAVIQPDPPTVSLMGKTSRSAALKWNIPWKLWLMDYLYLEHKVSYWYSGIHQIQVDTTGFQEIYVPTFELELELPCVGAFYEVRVSIKPKTAIGDEFWSEDALISFVTDTESEDVDAAVDPTCIRPKVTITWQIMWYEIEKFRDKTTEEQHEFKEKIMLLELRAGKT